MTEVYRNKGVLIVLAAIMALSSMLMVANPAEAHMTCANKGHVHAKNVHWRVNTVKQSGPNQFRWHWQKSKPGQSWQGVGWIVCNHA